MIESKEFHFVAVTFYKVILCPEMAALFPTIFYVTFLELIQITQVS